MIGNQSVYSTSVSYSHPFNHLAADRATAEESSEIRCICGFTHDDGFTIACDQCDTWQHGFCVDIAEDEVPDRYECPDCLPRALDVRKAVEYQQKNRKEQEEKSRRKKTKSGATSNASRRKENNSTHSITQTNGPAPPSIPDRTVSAGKPPASKDGSSHSRKRGSHRASISSASVANNGYLADSSNGALAPPTASITPSALSPAMTVATDRNPDGDSDTDMDRPSKVYRLDFTDITEGQDHYASREVQLHVNSLASAQDGSAVHLTRGDISAFSLPEISVHNAPGNSKPYTSLSDYFIIVDTPCHKGQLVVICKGDITFQQSYKADPINQYSVLRHPKPCVFFHPTQPLCIDSRIRGTVARFAKRSCRPNTTLATIVVDNSEVLFGLIAAEPLKARTPLTVEWEWSGFPSIQRLAKGAQPDQLDNDEYQDALCWANNLTEHMGECACLDKDECIFSKLRVKRESTTPKPFAGSARPQHGSRPSTTPQSSPDRQISSDRDNNISSSKSRSRDISPTMPEEMSGREARKMQDYISRIEKIEKEDHQPTSSKRRKRNNTVSGSGSVTVDSSAKGTETGRRSKNSSRAVTPPEPLSKASSSDQTSPPSHLPSNGIPSKDGELIRSRTSSNGPTQMQPPPAPIRKVKKVEYVDSSMQTDECENAWWNVHSQECAPRPGPMSLKERLMKSMLRERQRVAQEESRKRKQSEMVDGGNFPMEPCKGPKLAVNSDVKTKTILPSSPVTTAPVDIVLDEKPTNATSSPVVELKVESPASGASLSEVPLVKTPPLEHSPVEAVRTEIRQGTSSATEPIPSSPPSSQMRGPALADIFADSPPPQPTPVAEIIPDQKRTPPVSPCSTVSNLPHVPSPTPPPTTGRNFGLQVQLPAGPAFPTAPTTPSPVPASATSPAPVTPSAQPTSPFSMSATTPGFPPSALANQGPNATPAKTKKLSLSEYGNRRKKADTANDRERKGMLMVTEESQNMGLTDAVASPTTVTSST